MTSYPIWGSDGIDDNSKEQLTKACELPVARAAALMPDAHLGYGLPIGGVLATENAILPYGVGMDIACRMRLTITSAGPQMCRTVARDPQQTALARALRSGTVFGVGKEYENPMNHHVLDFPEWESTEHLQGLKDLAWRQLGTSGSGNHFVEWGLAYVPPRLAGQLHIDQGRYLALLSHSGSRGPGAKTCRKYTDLAKEQTDAGDLSWLDLATEEGQEYWEAMSLMGEYAAANHELIHRTVLNLAGFESIAIVENHHNFAWQEGDWIIHRKGATPAHAGELGVIPGSMASSTYIVIGKGNTQSLNSASHGAGRCMSRGQAKRELEWAPFKADLKEQGIWLLDAGLDEVKAVYKDIDRVMNAQEDLVDVVGRFDPKIVLMDRSGSRAED